MACRINSDNSSPSLVPHDLAIGFVLLLHSITINIPRQVFNPIGWRENSMWKAIRVDFGGVFLSALPKDLAASKV
jgi:hypothetical protein